MKRHIRLALVYELMARFNELKVYYTEASTDDEAVAERSGLPVEKVRQAYIDPKFYDSIYDISLMAWAYNCKLEIKLI